MSVPLCHRGRNAIAAAIETEKPLLLPQQGDSMAHAESNACCVIMYYRFARFLIGFYLSTPLKQKQYL